MFFAGIDIGGTTVKGCIMNERGRIVYQRILGSVRADPDALADNIAYSFSSFRSPIAAVGISCAGRVSTQTHLITAANLQWNNVPFEAMMEMRLRCPVFADNDVAGALYAESRAGVCVDVPYVVYIAMGTGIGGAFIINGYPFRGYGNDGGEIGHIITHADGLPCACGGRGCFEKYASSSALTKRAGMPVREIFRQVRMDNQDIIAILDDYVHELCIGLKSIVRIFHPNMVVFGGGIGSAGDALLSRVKKEMALSESILDHPGPEYVCARLGNLAGSIGGCLLAADAIGYPITITDEFQPNV